MFLVHLYMTKITEEKWKVLETEHLTNKLSIKEIAIKYKMSYTTIYYGFKRLKVPITSYSRDKRRYKVNDEFFKCIDTEDKAYILGILMADGYIHKNNTVCIKLQERDLPTIEYIRDLLCPDKPIFKDVSKINNKRFNSFKLEVCSDILCKDLQFYGIVPRKTGIETFPNLRNDLYCHFIRGYFDGDGSVSKKLNACPSKSYQFYICCTNKLFLEDMKSYLGFGKIYKEKRPTIDMYTYRLTNMYECVSFVKLMYENCKSYCMERKAIQCVDYVNTVLRHYSNVQCNA